MTVDSDSRGRLLFEALEQLGWSDAAEVAEFVRRLELGLPAEDELSVIFHWLGRCTLVHKLDQFPYPPGVCKHFRVPDLLSVFDVDGASVPVLIEVKTSTDSVLSWKPEYLQALQAYAALIRLPLLVAWQHQTFWTLFEARHLQKAKKNFNISFSDAMSETLLGLLAGDFSFSFRAGVGVHIKIRKLREMEDGFDGQIEEAYFLNAKGERHTGAGPFHLFACIDQEVLVQEDETHVVQSFVIQEDHQAEFAHRALVSVLHTFGEAPDPFVWRQVLLKEQLPLLATSPQQAARNALEAGFIRYVLNIRPKTRPTFIEDAAQKAEATDRFSASH